MSRSRQDRPYRTIRRAGGGGGGGDSTYIHSQKERKGKTSRSEWEDQRVRRKESSQTPVEPIASRANSLRNELGSYFSKLTQQLANGSHKGKGHNGKLKRSTLQTVNCESLVLQTDSIVGSQIRPAVSETQGAMLSSPNQFSVDASVTKTDAAQHKYRYDGDAPFRVASDWELILVTIGEKSFRDA
jgi:hypothetical protein